MKSPARDDRFAGDRRHHGQSRRAQEAPASPRPASPMNEIAERYVKLVLALGQHDADYVDAYYGPPEWKQQAESAQGAPRPSSRRRRKALAERGRRHPVSLRLRWSGCAATTCSGSSSAVARPHPDARRASACRSTRSRRRSTMRWRRPCPSRTSRRSSTSWTRNFPGDGPLLARYEKFRSGFVDPAREARRGLPGGHQGMPRAHARST